MKKFKKFYEPIYKAPIYYLFNCNERTARSEFKRVFDFEHRSMGEGKTISFDDNDSKKMEYAIWVRNIKDAFGLACLAHEVFHLSGFILTDRGYKYSAEDDEPFAYLIEFLFKKFIDLSKK